MSIRLFLLLIALLPVQATGQEQSHIDAAKHLMDLMNADQVIQQAYDQTYPHLAGMADQMGIPQEQRPVFEAYLEKMVVAMKEELNWEKMEPHILKVYVDIYTEEEIRELSEFYSSPLGQKFIAKMPELMEATMKMSQEMMQGFIPRMQKIQEEMMAELLEE